MITDTINRIQSFKNLPKHPYMKMYRGYYKMWNIWKRFILKILG